MPRPKGSKNRKKKATETPLDQIIAAKEEAAREVDSLAAEIDAATAELKEKKVALKTAKKKLAALETDESAAREAENALQRKAEAEKITEALLNSGKSVEEILAALGVSNE